MDKWGVPLDGFRRIWQMIAGSLSTKNRLEKSKSCKMIKTIKDFSLNVDNKIGNKNDTMPICYFEGSTIW
jgi:hypothetical protein